MIFVKVVVLRQPQHLGHVPVVLRNRAHADHRVDDRRPHRADRDGEERRRLGLLEDAPARAAARPAARSGRSTCMIGSNILVSVGDTPSRNPSGVAMAIPSRNPRATRTQAVVGQQQDALVRSRHAWRAAPGCRACSPPTSAPATAGPARTTLAAHQASQRHARCRTSGSSRLIRRFIRRVSASDGPLRRSARQAVDRERPRVLLGILAVEHAVEERDLAARSAASP